MYILENINKFHIVKCCNLFSKILNLYIVVVISIYFYKDVFNKLFYVIDNFY